MRLALLKLQVLLKLALFFLDHFDLVLQIVLLAQLLGFVGEVAHCLRQVVVI